MEQYDSGIRTCWRISLEQVACCTTNNNSNRRRLFVAKKVRKPLLLWWIAGCLLVGIWVQFWKCHRARSKREENVSSSLSSVVSKKFECSVRDCFDIIVILIMIFGGVLKNFKRHVCVGRALKSKRASSSFKMTLFIQWLSLKMKTVFATTKKSVFWLRRASHYIVIILYTYYVLQSWAYCRVVLLMTLWNYNHYE